MSGLWRGRLPIILASQSQTRGAILTAAGIPFEAYPAAIDERGIEAKVLGGGGSASDVALEISRAKVLEIAKSKPGRLVVGADQVLSLDGRLFGKPGGIEGAKAQLALLSGRTHELYSGYCVARDNTVLSSGVAAARLSCRRFSEEFIEAYLLETGAVESAGGYRIEGLGIHLFEKIEGDHTTILGLPLLPLLKFLRDEGSVLA